ncbi:hypothetical protein NC651_022698 [Populus alba x Populus x berolinensis]|nr:hypothetical protein NC651_022698 [Populus alba x Populus x berolinensis]
MCTYFRKTNLFLQCEIYDYHRIDFFCSFCSLTVITQLVHHGMLFVPIGYTCGAGMFRMDSIRGGSPCGAEVLSGDGTREPSETELAFVEHQGKYMAKVVKRFAWPFSFASGENHN